MAQCIPEQNMDAMLSFLSYFRNGEMINCGEIPHNVTSMSHNGSSSNI